MIDENLEIISYEGPRTYRDYFQLKIDIFTRGTYARNFRKSETPLKVPSEVS